MIPFSGLSGICPEINIMFPAIVTGEYGPIAVGKVVGKILCS